MTQTVIPLARSYDLNDWELSPGDVAVSTFENVDFLCFDQGCQINLPKLEMGEKYQLVSSAYSLGLRDEYARFLETASFGVTARDLDIFEAATGGRGAMGVIADFVESQMDEDAVPMSSHREFWRTRSNPRVRINVSDFITLCFICAKKISFLTLLSSRLLGRQVSAHLIILVMGCRGGGSSPLFATMLCGGLLEICVS